jgi:diguanylate cyclase (GGDEF)-like protein
MRTEHPLPESIMLEMGITPDEIERRKLFLELSERDTAQLAELHRYIAELNIESVFSNEFYRHLLAFGELARLLPDEVTVNRLKALQAAYFKRLTAGNYDRDYVLGRVAVGHTHQRMGLEPKWYTGAYRKFLATLIPVMQQMAGADAARFEALHNALLKAVFFDMQLALDTYFHSDREALRHIASHDALTGLPNRALFCERLQREIGRAKRENYRIALLQVDLDEFKEINDTLGHAAGDRLLVEAVRRIKECVRESDLLARVGGDEFAVTLAQLPDAKHAENVAEKIIGRLAAPYHLGSEIAYLSASVGITLCPDHADDLDALLSCADQAVSCAKRRGRGRWCHFIPAMHEAAQHRLRLTNDLRGALAAGQFCIHYQPIVELATGGIHKAEALLRWQHPERGMIYPSDFIPLAEASGLIIEIGDWVFKESARWAKRWGEQYDHGFQISVNESPVQFMNRQVSINVSPAQFDTHSHIFAEEWLTHLAELGLSGGSVVVEITEGLLLDAEPDILEKLLKLRDAGIQVAIDDFGTGYSSLSYLKKFDIDYLKIDQSFVRELETNPNDRTLCQAIVVMAHTLGLKVIAEGVETKAQRDILIKAGCDYAQGYLFAQPMPPEQFEALLSNSNKGYDAATKDS